MTRENGIVALDFDHVIDPVTGQLDVRVIEIIELLNSYAEVSPSGTGVRMLVRGKLPPLGRKRNQGGAVEFEVYDHGRYVTVTGHKLPGVPATIEARETELLEFHARYIASSENVITEAGNGEAARTEVDDDLGMGSSAKTVLEASMDHPLSVDEVTTEPRPIETNLGSTGSESLEDDPLLLPDFTPTPEQMEKLPPGVRYDSFNNPDYISTERVAVLLGLEARSGAQEWYGPNPFGEDKGATEDGFILFSSGNAYDRKLEKSYPPQEVRGLAQKMKEEGAKQAFDLTTSHRSASAVRLEIGNYLPLL